ncbi:MULTISPECIES: MATE family efflux transporter [Francisella]|uniref:MATE family efflux transporter n=1 Tax=Francisella TaxID=262 RepID=UPI0011B81BF3|nr:MULTISPECIES: MATE family efflux transporter [Francisella]
MHKKIFLLSLPLILSNLVLPMVGIVNTALIGHLSDSNYLAAIGLGVSIINVICFMFSFFRMSLTGLIAQSLNNLEKMLEIVIKAVLIALLISIIVFSLKSVILIAVLKIVNTSFDIKMLLENFYNVAIYILLFSLLNYIFIGFFIGVGNPRVVLYSSIIYMSVAIGLSTLLVVILNYNVVGVAVSLVIASASCSIYLSTKIFRYFYKSGSFSIKKLVDFKLLNFGSYMPFLQLNINIFVRSLCLLLAFNSFYIFSSNYGKTILAANTILVEIGMFFAMFLDALANTTESLVAQAYVDKNTSLLRETIYKTFVQSMILTLVLSIVYFTFSGYIISIFTDIVDVRIQINKYIIFSFLMPLFASFSFWIDGVFVGLLKTVAMRNAMILSAGVYIAFVFLLQPYENYGLWIALILFYIARTVFLMPPLGQYIKKGV